MAENFSLKDELFNPETVAYLAGLFRESDPNFDADRFQNTVVAGLPSRELKERITFIAEVLEDYLSSDFKIAAQQIERALPPPLDPTKTDNDFGRFIMAPLGDYVVHHGLEDFETSMPLLKQLTQRFSMELPMRHFINRWPEEVLDVFADWMHDANYHVRRLVSESTRPKLPWGKGITINHDAPLCFLDQLFADPTRYVTRSVANHLNDISKIDSELVISRLKNWRDQARQDEKELGWITGHALRTLIKQGHPGALELLGYDPNAAVSVDVVLANSRVVMGDALEFEVTLKAAEPHPVLVDFVVDFVKANGQTAPKVFKLKTVNLTPDTPLTISKRHVLKANATTFTLHPGRHRLSIQVNGVIRAGVDFDLVDA